MRIKAFKNCSYKETLAKTCWADFDANSERIFQQVYLLNWNEYVVRKTKGGKSDIGKIIFNNSFESAVLLVWKLVIDQKYSYTLQKLEKLIRSNLRFRVSHERQLRRALHNLDFANKIKSIEQEIIKERNEIIAHHKKVSAGTFPITQEEIQRKVTLTSALNLTTRRINRYYDTLKLKKGSAVDLYARISKIRRLGEIFASLIEIPNEHTIQDLLGKS